MSSKTPLKTILKTFELFEGIGESLLTSIEKHCEEPPPTKGRFIKQGSDVSHLYLLVEGTVMVYRGAINRKEKGFLLGCVSAPAILGEIEVVLGMPAVTHVTAPADVHLVTLPARFVRKLVSRPSKPSESSVDAHSLAANLVNLVARRCEEQIRSEASKSASGELAKIADFILAYVEAKKLPADRDGFVVIKGLNPGKVCDVTGTTTKTRDRFFKECEKEGIIRGRTKPSRPKNRIQFEVNLELCQKKLDTFMQVDTEDSDDMDD